MYNVKDFVLNLRRITLIAVSPNFHKEQNESLKAFSNDVKMVERFARRTTKHFSIRFVIEILWYE